MERWGWTDEQLMVWQRWEWEVRWRGEERKRGMGRMGEIGFNLLGSVVWCEKGEGGIVIVTGVVGY
jgi:hypothetical protein